MPVYPGARTVPSIPDSRRDLPFLPMVRDGAPTLARK
jgi:hypothetical protein